MRINNQMNYQTPNFQATARVFRLPMTCTDPYQRRAWTSIQARTIPNLARPLYTKVRGDAYYMVRGSEIPVAEEVLDKFMTHIPSITIDDAALKKYTFNGLAQNIARSGEFEAKLHS